MSQHDYNIANGGGAAVRADLNAALLAILSQNSGATAPATTKPFMPWYDTTTGILKIRNADDSAWVTFAAGAIADASIAQAKLATGVAGTGPAFSAYQSSTTQNITQNVWTKVQYNQELFDTESAFDRTTNYRFQPLVAGYYQVNGCVAIGTAGGMYMGVVKNGTVYQYGTNTGASGNNYQGLINTVMYLNGSTDYIEIYVAPISASITVTADGTKTWFNAALVRAA